MLLEVKTNALLTELIKEAKKIGDNENEPLTAEKFFVAVINKVGADNSGSNDDDLKLLTEFARSSIKDFHGAIEYLLSYINKTHENIFLDDLYMRERMKRAYDSGSKLDEKLSASELFMNIVNSPTEPIKKVLSFSKKEPAAVTDEKVENNGDYSNLSDLEFEEMLKDLEDWLSDEAETDESEPLDTNSEEEKPEQPDDGVSEETAEETVKETKEEIIEELKSDEEEKVPANYGGAKMTELILDVKRIESELQGRIYGQNNAISMFATGYFRANMLSMMDKTRRRPKATFLFAGPPGVGKTFLAEEVAEILELPFMRFDMSEYANKEANLEFCGNDKVYKSAKPGNVTSFVAENPKCVLLFDEVEKAHSCVINLFLQILDAGRVRDNYTDEEVSFTDATIIFTTNAGKQLYEESESGDFSSVSKKVIIKALRDDKNPNTGVPFFSGAICSRFASGNVVMFNHIGAHDLHTIAKNEIERQVKNFENETGIKINIDERVYTALLLAEGGNVDARTVRARAESFFNDELYELLRLIASEKVQSDISDIEKVQISVDLSRTCDDITSLFELSDKMKMIVLSSEEAVAVCKEKAPEFDIIGVQDLQGAIEKIKSDCIDFILLDMKYGTSDFDSNNLNIEDVQSPARDFLKFLKEHNNATPIYLAEVGKNEFSDEEKNSFMHQGVRGVIHIGGSDDEFKKQLELISNKIHQQASMIKLAKENKLISYETAQTVSDNGRNAEIKLFDFKMAVAVDSQDAKNVLSSVSKPNVHFDDIIGASDAKKELTYFVKYLKNPKKYMGTGVKAPKGVLLYGPPGTGKTMLAKAMACESGVTFITAEGNQFLKKYVGEGSEKVHQLFKTARKYAPSILFIDEIDAIGKERRGGVNSGANGEAALTAFLAEMDGFTSDPTKPVFVLAATNFDVEPGTDKSLDCALMHRFDRRVYIDLPDKDGRIKFMNMKISGNTAFNLSHSQIENIAMRSTSMSLAQIDSVFELALRSAIREGSTVVTDAILEEAFETYNSGEAKKWDVSQLERVARHESGHALLCTLNGEKPSYLTIVARGKHGGYMQHAENEGKAIYTKDELLARIRTSLGGRAAEIVCYGEKDGVSTGASGDLETASNLARQIVCSYGMDDEFGLAVCNSSAFSDGTLSREVRTAVNRILKDQMAQAIQMIYENRDKLDSLVEVLLNKNHLNGEEIQAAINGTDVS